MPGRKQYAGGAPQTHLTGSLAGSPVSFSINESGAGYPDGTVGPFVVCLGRGTPLEEKILVTSRTGASFVIGTRGYDNTLQTDHAAGETVDHVLDADSVNEANAHVNDITRDDHSQYIKQDGSEAFTGVAGVAAIPGSSAPGDAAAKGSGPTLATSNHVHGREAFGLTGDISTQAAGDAAAAGTSAKVPHADHKHAMPAADPAAGTAGFRTLGTGAQQAAPGTTLASANSHADGADAAHVAAADPHPGYLRDADKAADSELLDGIDSIGYVKDPQHGLTASGSSGAGLTIKQFIVVSAFDSSGNALLAHGLPSGSVIAGIWVTWFYDGDSLWRFATINGWNDTVIAASATLGALAIGRNALVTIAHA